MIEARSTGLNAFWGFVHADYVRRAHKGEDLEAVVTRDGTPIECNGETLTVGMCPPERRFGIGPAINGMAEILPQHEFDREHERVYMAAFALRNAPAYEPKLRAIPNVYEFVAVKEDPYDRTAFLPLGMGVIAPVTPTEHYSAEDDKFVPFVPERDGRDDLIEELQAALEKVTVPTSTQAVEQSPEAKPQEEAPCGMMVAKGYISRHKRTCVHEACKE